MLKNGAERKRRALLNGQDPVGAVWPPQRPRVSRAAASGDCRSAMACLVDYWNGDGACMCTKPELQAALPGEHRRLFSISGRRCQKSTPPTAYRRIAVPTLVLRGARSPRPNRRIAEL